jgi:DNA-binding GntR family transcriptional regulator
MAESFLQRRVVDKESPVPIYHQIASDIRTFCMSEEWVVGDKIPSEKELTEMYGVSRVTLRQALAELEHDGVIRKLKGYGSILAIDPKPVSQTLSLPGMSEGFGMQAPATNFSPKVITMEQCSPIPSINRMLHLNDKHTLIYIKRLFFHGKRPVALNRSWLNPEMVPGILEKGLEQNRMSLTLINRYKLHAHSITNTMESINCTPIDMKLLDITYNTPAILVTSISYLEDETPLEYSKTVWLGGHVKFKFSVNRVDTMVELK